jgi:hypothetical protein
MKKLIAIAALVMAAVTTPAMAGTLTAEAKFGDVRGGAHPDATSYKLDYTTNVVGNVIAGAEVQVSQPEDGGRAKTKLSAKAGYSLPEVLGIHTVAYGEAGEAFADKVTTRVGNRNVVTGGNFEFWGAGVKASRHIYGPLSVVAGYRHRESFKNHDGVDTDRLNAGLSYEVREGTSVTANYYRTRGTANLDTIGIAISQKF